MKTLTEYMSDKFSQLMYYEEEQELKLDFIKMGSAQEIIKTEGNKILLTSYNDLFYGNYHDVLADFNSNENYLVFIDEDLWSSNIGGVRNGGAKDYYNQQSRLVIRPKDIPKNLVLDFLESYDDHYGQNPQTPKKSVPKEKAVENIKDPEFMKDNDDNGMDIETIPDVIEGKESVSVGSTVAPMVLDSDADTVNGEIDQSGPEQQVLYNIKNGFFQFSNFEHKVSRSDFGLLLNDKELNTIIEVCQIKSDGGFFAEAMPKKMGEIKQKKQDYLSF